MEKTRGYLAVTAPDARSVQGMGLPCLCLYYRIGENGSLQRVQLQLSPRGGLMGVYEAPGLPLCQPEKLARDIQSECNRRGFQGVVVDFPAEGEGLNRLAQLCAALQRLQVRVWLPAELEGAGCGDSVIIAPAAVSGGSFAQLVEDLCSRYRPENLCLDLVRGCHDFPMPSYRPDGQRLSPAQFRARLEQAGGQSFFSAELCCRYFTYRQEDGSMHFVLFDDVSTAAAKLEHIRRAGVGQVLLLFSEWGMEAKDLLQG